MEDYSTKDNALTNKALVLLEKTLIELERLKIDRITDVTLCRNYDSLIQGIENTKTLIHKNPRFGWVSINDTIDMLYKSDPKLTGVLLKLNWKEGNNCAIIKVDLKKVP